MNSCVPCKHRIPGLVLRKPNEQFEKERVILFYCKNSQGSAARIGQKAIRSAPLTAAHVKKYAEITGGYNHLHFDSSFMAKTKFKRLMVQGRLTAGLLHALVANEMPGPKIVFLSQNWKFTAPVHIGNTITAEAKIPKIYDTKSGT